MLVFLCVGGYLYLVYLELDFGGPQDKVEVPGYMAPDKISPFEDGDAFPSVCSLVLCWFGFN